MERLGDTAEFGQLLLGMLRLAGWTVLEHHGFAGGVVVEAVRGQQRVRVRGSSVAEVASVVFQEATRSC